MSKILAITISDEQWQAFKEAVANELITEEADFEHAAGWAMSQTIDRRIKEHKHPETGLSKQQMTHHRRGVLAAKQWRFSEKSATREEFEEAGRTWSARASKFEYIQELILQGWLSMWK